MAYGLSSGHVIDDVT